MRIIFDNNIWISLLIGKRLTALRPLFERADVEVFFCDLGWTSKSCKADGLH